MLYNGHPPAKLLKGTYSPLQHQSTLQVPEQQRARYPGANIQTDSPRCSTTCWCWCCGDRCLGGGGCAGEPSNILARPRPTVGVEQSTSCFTSLCTQLTTALVCTLLLGSCTTKCFCLSCPASSTVMLKAKEMLMRATNKMKSILVLKQCSDCTKGLC
eukprot:TRINITY_DN10157_c0_g1_i2.p1 TRINITY_DN10157_c0_g1~~TRINITY_DN10157_c0_g1_i2.p1  ORF type:complete len:158 (+),score=17.09 TRINITY_DN10157_c0_g1_i2:53-526(+)